MQAAKLILMTELTTDAPKADAILDAFLPGLPDTSAVARSVYQRHDGKGSSILELVELPSLAALSALLETRAAREREERLQPALVNDWRRQVLALRESVKEPKQRLPRSENLQLRHIEVPPRVLAEYHEWRRGSIFSHVQKRAEIDSFTAYHSLLSTEPGVMFFVEFSGSVADYVAGYDTPEYKEFIRLAGTRYIAGGPASLSTSLWTRVAAFEGNGQERS
jgi:hypothetical protein